MTRSGRVYIRDQAVGLIWEDDDGFSFKYDEKYLENPIHGEVSLTLPLDKKTYKDKSMLPFFDGLIPEGFLLKVALKNWKLNERDRMGILLNACNDCIGAVSIKKVTDEK